MSKVTVVVPVYNEESGIVVSINAILENIKKNTKYQIDILIVDDGSTDQTKKLMSEFCRTNKGVFLLSLTRNFGKEAAIMAGLHYSTGDAVVIMDSDLQHPPQLLSDMIEKWEDGYKVVECVKNESSGNSMFYRSFSRLFYWLFLCFSGFDLKNHSDFKLLDKKIVAEYCSLGESGRFFRGLIHWMNFKTYQITFTTADRSHGGSSWKFFKLVRFAVSALVSFSSIPLYFIAMLGVGTMFFGLFLGGIALFQKFSGIAVDGFTTIIIINLLIGSTLMFSIGLIGVYIAKIYDEVKRRPVFLVDLHECILR